MRIHTKLTERELLSIPVTPGVAMHALVEHGSRTHERAFEVILSGGSVFRGQYGQSNFSAATWDEWGVYLGRLFGLDPSARVAGAYRDAEHFHYVTNDRYEPTALPERLCPRHRWTYAAPYESECAKCGARLTNNDPYKARTSVAAW